AVAADPREALFAACFEHGFAASIAQAVEREIFGVPFERAGTCEAQTEILEHGVDAKGKAGELARGEMERDAGGNLAAVQGVDLLRPGACLPPPLHAHGYGENDEKRERRVEEKAAGIAHPPSFTRSGNSRKRGKCRIPRSSRNWARNSAG